MSGTVHMLYTHAVEYLDWAKDTVGVPLGAMSECAMENHNKVKKHAKKRHARLDTLTHQSEDTHHAAMWPSCPKLLEHSEHFQRLRESKNRRRRRCRRK